MRKLLKGGIGLAICLGASSAFAESVGPVLPAEPGGFRFELGGGAFLPQFARFRYGDVRIGFPRFGNPFLSEAWNERPTRLGGTGGATLAYGLATPLLGAQTEIIGGFNYARATHRSFSADNSAGPNVFVPYIDGVQRLTLTGRTTVVLNTSNQFELERIFRAYSVHAGVRQQYTVQGWTLSPAAIFIYRRVEQRDFLSGTTNGDVAAHTLSANINSNHFQIGGSIGVSRPVFVSFVWFGNLSGGADIVHASYRGQQTFGPSGTFNEPAEQFASASNSRTRVGAFAGAQTGVIYVLFPGAAVTLAGTFRYTSVLPYVIYPTPVTGTPNVDGPARLGFQGQVVIGTTLNFSIKF